MQSVTSANSSIAIICQPVSRPIAQAAFVLWAQVWRIRTGCGLDQQFITKPLR